MKAKEMSCNACTAGGATKEFGCRADGSALLETDVAVAARRKELAALCGKCNCKTGCTGRCGCAKRGRPCNGRCFCRKTNGQCNNNCSPVSVLEVEGSESDSLDVFEDSDLEELGSSGIDRGQFGESGEVLELDEAEVWSDLDEDEFAISTAATEDPIEDILAPTHSPL